MLNVSLCLPLDHIISGREGDSDDWAPQDLHIFRPYICALKRSLPEQIAVSLDATGCLRPWEEHFSPTGQLPPTSSCAAPNQLGADPPQSACLELKGKTEKQTVKHPHQAKRKRRNCHLMGRCALASQRTNCSMMIPGKRLSSIGSSRGSTLTSLLWRRKDFHQMAASVNRTIHSFGRVKNQGNIKYMELVLQ